MESLVKSDIFFFITTICILVVTSLLLMILSHVLHIVKKVRKTIDCVHTETSGIADDFAAFREILRKNQFGFKPVFHGIKKTADSFTEKPKPARAKKVKVKIVEKPAEPTNYV